MPKTMINMVGIFEDLGEGLGCCIMDDITSLSVI